MSVGFRVDASDLAHITKHLDPAIYAGEVRAILTKGAIQGENLGKEVAPVDTGRLRASITHQVAAGNPPPFSRYGTNVGYGKRLDESREAPYRYRRGPRQGTPLKGWLTNTISQLQPFVQELIADAVTRIERQWRHG